MVLGIDFYDTITAWPVAIRKLSETILAGGGQVHIVSAVKRKNEDKTRRHIKDSRVPFTTVNLVFYEKYADIPKLKVPVYKELGCDIIIEDNEMVVLEARDICPLLISGISNSPLTIQGI